MISEKHIAAMNGEIDGTNTREESARLRELLDSSEEARSYFEELARLGNMLSDIPIVEPPPELKTRILGVIRAKQQIGREPAAQPSESWLDKAQAGFQHRSRWAFGFAFAAGVAFGIIGYAAFGDGLLSPGPVTDHLFTGSMAPSEATVPIERLELDQAGIIGHIETRSAPDRFLAEIAVNSEQELEIVIAFDDKVLSPIGFAQERPGTAEIAVGAEAVRLSHHGSNVYLVTLDYPAAAPSEIQVKFYSDGLIFEKALNTHPANP